MKDRFYYSGCETRSEKWQLQKNIDLREQARIRRYQFILNFVEPSLLTLTCVLKFREIPDFEMHLKVCLSCTQWRSQGEGHWALAQWLKSYCPRILLKCYQLPNAEKSRYTCMFEDPSGFIVTQCLLWWSNQVIQKDEPTIFPIKSMIIIRIITAQWYFFVKILAILCYFCFIYAYFCYLCSIYAYSLWVLLSLYFFI